MTLYEMLDKAMAHRRRCLNCKNSFVCGGIAGVWLHCCEKKKTVNPNDKCEKWEKQK